MIMQVLMRKPMGKAPDWENYIMYNSTATPRLAGGGKTVRSFIDAEQDYTYSSTYSRELRSPIAECLLLNSSNWIPVQDLVQRTADGVATLRMGMGTVLEGQALPVWQGPALSAKWVGGQEAFDLLGNAVQQRSLGRDREDGQRDRTAMNLMRGRTLMLNHQALGGFPGLDVVRALDA
jgi:hypothetical protein